MKRKAIQCQKVNADIYPAVLMKREAPLDWGVFHLKVLQAILKSKYYQG
jgi:hypothetical protein